MCRDPIIPNSNITTVLCGNNFDLGPLTDTVTLRDIVHWYVGGTGIHIGQGSETRIMDGRIIGPALRNDSSIGIYIGDNNGGIYITDTNVVGFSTGILFDNAYPNGSHRQIFITQTRIDSNGIGLHIKDSSHVLVSNCFIASSDKHQILLDHSATGAHLQVTGGTIFNGGVLGGDCSEIGQECNGITVLEGQFGITGVLIWANRRIGIWVPHNNGLIYCN